MRLPGRLEVSRGTLPTSGRTITWAQVGEDELGEGNEGINITTTVVRGDLEDVYLETDTSDEGF